jgi:hypothetical protein
MTARRRQPEATLQRLLIEHLRCCARGDVCWTHIPNDGWRSPIEAAIFKSLGVQVGSSDLLIIRAGQALFIECKAPGRKLSPAQVGCAHVCPSTTISRQRSRRKFARSQSRERRERRQRRISAPMQIEKFPSSPARAMGLRKVRR